MEEESSNLEDEVEEESVDSLKSSPNDKRAVKKRASLFLSLKDLVIEKGRGALSETYLEIRCGNFHNDDLYLDLTGRIVEEHLGRRLDDEDLSSICTFLVKNKKVIYLSLGYNLITERGFCYLARYLVEDSTLLTLNLCQNEICSLNEGVLRSTAPLWKLRCLLLRGNKLGAKEGLVLGRLLRYNESLRHLDIGETEQTIQSVSHIIQSLLSVSYDGNTTLQKLILNRIVPASQQGFIYSSHLSRFVQQLLLHNRTIVELHLERNEIADWDLELIISALGENKVLELINLGGNRLTSHGLELLSTVLPETNIQYLILSSNQIGNDGAIALGRVFSETKILFLDISRNKIQDIGMINLLWGVTSKNPPLHTLFIYGNPITKETIQVLHKKIYIGHISPYALDIQFTVFNENVDFAEDRTSNKFRNTYYFVHELSAYKRPLHHSCCYLPSMMSGKSRNYSHLPYRTLLPPEKDEYQRNRTTIATSIYYNFNFLLE